MRIPGDANWPSSWPHYLPLAQPIVRSTGPAPNVNSINWPQSQFAPLYLPPGSPSYQPYSYKKNNRPLSEVQLRAHRVPNPKALGPISQNAYKGGPGGDSVALPSYGDAMHTPVVRQGWIPSSTPIQPGVPHSNPAPMPPAVATAGLIPLHSALGALALRNGGAKCNCGTARMNPLSDASPAVKLGLAAAVLGGIYYVWHREKSKHQLMMF